MQRSKVALAPYFLGVVTSLATLARGVGRGALAKTAYEKNSVLFCGLTGFPPAARCLFCFLRRRLGSGRRVSRSFGPVRAGATRWRKAHGSPAAASGHAPSLGHGATTVASRVARSRVLAAWTKGSPPRPSMRAKMPPGRSRAQASETSAARASSSPSSERCHALVTRSNSLDRTASIASQKKRVFASTSSLTSALDASSRASVASAAAIDSSDAVPNASSAAHSVDPASPRHSIDRGRDTPHSPRTRRVIA
mmetsp:Transcript_8477/g.26436  ORF Transcript_8477/g.26436 Transcript_8477/m.26436 type:complete len:252 (-) Transcript_8477:227-982(-)